MDIKARVVKNKHAQCNCCLKKKEQVLDMFDFSIPLGSEKDTQLLRLCDECTDKLFFKALRCNCYTNARIKSQKDLIISNTRRSKRMKEQYGEEEHIPINPPGEKDDEWEKAIREFED